jgi:hypothetical protein
MPLPPPHPPPPSQQRRGHVNRTPMAMPFMARITLLAAVVACSMAWCTAFPFAGEGWCEGAQLRAAGGVEGASAGAKACMRLGPRDVVGPGLVNPAIARRVIVIRWVLDPRT